MRRCARRFPALLLGATLLAAAVFILYSAAPAQATTLAKWALDDFVVNSHAAVTGTVTGVEVKWNDEHTQIHSYVTLDIDQVVAGARVPNPLVLDQFGGRVGRIIAVQPGAPVYRSGEQVFVFVEKTNDAYRTLGFYQGKYSLEVDPDTGRAVYVQRVPAGGVGVAGPEGMRDPEAAVFGRDELIQRVREIDAAR